MRHPFFRTAPPKSTGRELFGEVFFNEALKQHLPAPDLLATLTELTARSIALNYRLHLRTLPEVVILAGGGSKNSFLVARIATALQELHPSISVETTADRGWDPQVIEASAFGLIAWLTYHQQPGNIASTTGAKGPRILGQVTSFVPPRTR